MHWENTDHCYLIDHELNSEDFVDEFIKKLVNLMSHHYIAKHQSIFFKSCKENHQLGQGFLVLDFAENYSFVVQDASQSFHWNDE